MWVVDFTKITNVDRDYLTPDRRIRALSELGWGLFRQRLALAGTRATADIEKFIEVGAATWAESELETLWVSNDGDAAGFQQWLEAYDQALPYLSRGRALEEGDIDAVRSALDEHPATP